MVGAGGGGPGRDLGGEQLAAAWQVAWVRMGTDGTVDWSPGCPAEVFTGSR